MDKSQNTRKLTALQTWISEEFEAGYRAGLAGVSESRTATPCWRAGWQEAQQERSLSQDAADLSPDAKGLVPSSGREARLFGFAFRGGETEQWKRAWIEADVECGQRTGS